MRILLDYFENFSYLPGVITHLYRSHPISIIAIEDKNIGNFCAAMLKLQSISEFWSPKGQFSDTITLKLIGRVTVHSIKSDNATVPMKALCAVLILFLQKKIFLKIGVMGNSWNDVMNCLTNFFDRCWIQIRPQSASKFLFEDKILFLSPCNTRNVLETPTFKFLWYAIVKKIQVWS